MKSGSPPESIVGARRVPAWKMVDGKQERRTCLVAKGHQDPCVKDGSVDALWCASLGSSHVWAISVGALKKWGIWSLDFKNAFLKADGFGRGVFPRSPAGRDPGSTRRVCKLRKPAYSLNDAPAAFQSALQRYFLNSGDSLARAAFNFVSFFVKVAVR